MIERLYDKSTITQRYKQQKGKLNKFDAKEKTVIDTAITVNNKTYASPEEASKAIEDESMKALQKAIVETVGKENVYFDKR